MRSCHRCSRRIVVTALGVAQHHIEVPGIRGTLEIAAWGGYVNNRVPIVAVGGETIEIGLAIGTCRRNSHTVSGLCRDTYDTAIQIDSSVACGAHHQHSGCGGVVHSAVQSRQESSEALIVFSALGQVEYRTEAHVDYVRVDAGRVLDTRNHPGESAAARFAQYFDRHQFGLWGDSLNTNVVHGGGNDSAYVCPVIEAWRGA